MIYYIVKYKKSNGDYYYLTFSTLRKAKNYVANTFNCLKCIYSLSSYYHKCRCVPYKLVKVNEKLLSKKGKVDNV